MAFDSIGQSSRYGGTADYNGDGRSDIALVEYNSCCPPSSNITIAYGQADGTFVESPPVAQVGLHSYPFGMLPGDFNGDGRPDFIVLDGYYTVFLNAGDGTFRGLPSQPIGATTFGRIAAGDFTGDGKLDFVIGVQGGPSGPLYLFAGKGDGTFDAPTAIGQAGNYVLEVVAADLNHDGFVDLVYQNTNGSASPGTEQVRVLLNDGHGNFTDFVPSAIRGVSGPFTLTDLNGDGVLDLFAAVTDPQYNMVGVLFLGTGDGNFYSANLGVPLGDLFLLEPPMIAGDFDGDGLTDIAVFRVVQGPYHMLVLWNDGGGQFTGQWVPTFETFAAWTGDVDGDGITDVIQPGGLLLAVARGRSDRRMDGGSPMFPITKALAFAADVDGDGAAEVLYAGRNDDSYFIQGSLFKIKPDGSFRRMALTPPGGQRLYDIDGDGMVDLLGISKQMLVIWKGDGTGSFTNIVAQIPISVRQDAAYWQVADLDRDGHIDIAVSGTLLYGKGGFQFDQVPFPGTAELSFRVADFDGDGLPDLFTDTAIFFGNGNRTFSEPTKIAVPLNAWVADMNGDGKSDYVTAGKDVRIWYSEGRTGFVLGQTLNFGKSNRISFEAPRVGDFNGDGRMDIGVGVMIDSNVDTTVAVFASNASGAYDVTMFTVGVSSPPVIADVNGDGKPDLIFGAGGFDYQAVAGVAILHR